ncbi:MAG: hypothetical protein KJ062_12770 [Thermoanaerobaculia bacterium]|nr:hypothetical protein [Thermoanaerobaculia bacterium]
MPTILPTRAVRLARLLPALVVGLLAQRAATGVEPAAPPPADGWVAFEAAWSAAGRRQVLKAGDREVVTAHLSGAFAVVRGEGLPRGFRGEALFYADGRGAGLGTLVLTDDRGDQVFSDLVGEAAAGGPEIRGTIRGGTGAYSGISGELSFRWRHLVKTPDGEVQGVAEDFKGRLRRPARSAPEKETPR